MRFRFFGVLQSSSFIVKAVRVGKTMAAQVCVSACEEELFVFAELSHKCDGTSLRGV